jgi:hypothetical protein
MYVIQVGDPSLYINEYIMNVYKTIRFSSIRPKQTLKLCDRKASVKIPKL